MIKSVLPLFFSFSAILLGMVSLPNGKNLGVFLLGDSIITNILPLLLCIFAIKIGNTLSQTTCVRLGKKIGIVFFTLFIVFSAISIFLG